MWAEEEEEKEKEVDAFAEPDAEADAVGFRSLLAMLLLLLFVEDGLEEEEYDVLEPKGPDVEIVKDAPEGIV